MLLNAQIRFSYDHQKLDNLPRFVQKIDKFDRSSPSQKDILLSNNNFNLTELLSNSLSVMNLKLVKKCGKFLEYCIKNNTLINLNDSEIQEIKNLVNLKKKELDQFRFIEYEKLNAKKKDIHYDDVVSYSSTFKNPNSQIHQDLHSQEYKGNGLELKPIKSLDAGYLPGAIVPKRPQPLQLKDISQMKKINSKNDFNFVRNYPQGIQYHGPLLNNGSPINNVITNTKDYSITESQQNIENNLGHQDFGEYRSDKFSPDGSNVIEVIQPKKRVQTTTSLPPMMISKEAKDVANQSDENLIQQSEEMMNQMEEDAKENQQLLNQEAAQQQVMNAQTPVPERYNDQPQQLELQNNEQFKVDDQRFMKKSKSESNSQSKSKSKHKKHHSMTEQKNLEYDIKQLKFQIKSANQEIFKISGTKPIEDYSELEGKELEEQIEILQAQLSTAKDQKKLLQDQNSNSPSASAPKPNYDLPQPSFLPAKKDISLPMIPQINQIQNQSPPQQNKADQATQSSEATPEQMQDEQLDDEFQKLMEID